MHIQGEDCMVNILACQKEMKRLEVEVIKTVVLNSQE